MSAKNAKRARQAEGVVKTPKVGTPLEQRKIDPVFNRATGGFGPSRRQHRRIADAIKVRDMDKEKTDD